MKFLEKYGFDNDEIQEALDNTPQKLQDQINKHLELVEENLQFIQGLGIDTYKEIFINYPELFLMDSSNFSEKFNQYETDDLIARLNANFKLVVLAVAPALYVVENSPSKSGKPSDPILSVVTAGCVIFSGITYSSLSSSNNFFASSIDIAKSTPSTCGYNVNGF